ncbi:MAG: cytochrome c biogenesis protein CcsA [Euryarchaeota archaeon]|nr:cytochrome c biogenesis protein CcsA [Euryarchaeota archaeon]
MNGDLLLYAAFAGGGCAAAGILLGRERLRRFGVVALFGFLLTATLVLSYAFAVSDFSYYYVWKFSSSVYPLYYKLSGVLAGQEGTLLFWAMLIAAGGLWLERNSSELSRRAQLVVVGLALYFTGMTLVQSPFEPYPGSPPPEGYGLNPLLLDPWMALHPLTTFLGYGATAVPFAGAVVYLLMSARGSSDAACREWVTEGLQWLRYAWLFSTISMAFGGIWAYKTLGWGGFWAWDPVEASMLLPWMVMTAALHLSVEHRRNMRRYSVLAPLLTAYSFTFTVFATAVTRSGIFESVHAFIAGGAGKYVMVLLGISAAVPLLLGLWKWYRFRSSISRSTRREEIFYAAVLVLIVMTFIVFYGVSFPPVVKLLTAKKYAVTKQFFNLWLYPFFLLLLLITGLGLSYSESRRREAMREFLIFSAITVLAVFIKPGENFNIVDYTSFISAKKPLLYATVGEISALSVLPPVAYILYACSIRARLMGLRMREMGVVLIHGGLAVIAIGVVFSPLFTSEFSASFQRSEVGMEKPLMYAEFHEGFGRLGTWGVHTKEVPSEYSAVLLGVREYLEGLKTEGYWRSVSELMRANLSEGEVYSVRGYVDQAVLTEHAMFIRLVDGGSSLWVAAPPYRLSKGEEVVATGMVLLDVPLPDGTTGAVLLSERLSFLEEMAFRRVQEVEIEVLRGGRTIAEGVMKYETYSNGDARRPMIDRNLWGDVFAVLDMKVGDEVSMTVRIKPFINLVWIGVALFVLGIVLCILQERRLEAHRSMMQ